MTYDELTGTFVLVNPALLTDHHQKQGEIGIITGTCDADDCYFISFNTGDIARYSPQDLLVFKKPSMIYFDMMRNATKMDTADFKELFRVSMLLDSGLHKDTRKAIALARAKPVVLRYSMVVLSATLGSYRFQRVLL